MGHSSRDALPTSAQIRGIEAEAFASRQAESSELMEQAGQAVVAAILRHWPEYAETPPRTLILCGSGNNGGDGYVVARLLHARGWSVEVRPTAPPTTNEARANRARATSTPVEDPELIIDALLGIGRPRPFTLALSDARIVAIDMPTGLDTDTGHAVAPRIRADLTVTFHAAKPGHYLAEGPDLTGHLHVADLGLPVTADLHLAAPDIPSLRKARGHKFDHGHALVLCGASGQGGAARMSARAALRIGAGLVTLAPPALAIPEHAARLDAIMLRAVDDPRTLEEMLADARINALCLGPGLGVERAKALLPVALRARRPTVLDADALTALAATDLVGLHPDCVLTPHPGEFARLFPDLAQAMTTTPPDWPMSKPDAVREAARRAGCTVLLKGHDTVIADPTGRAVLAHASHDRAAPWLATAGAGDVLAGMITGLLARGVSPFSAAETGAWLHIECARQFGPGLTAEDLPDLLPPVFRKLGV
ncbi:NAD(P)H-hydrate dehydratase [Falsirhodobacter sp. 20TX0035]|nr:NAD(P)H-hydrate dehydratase [Falsirhodobacter sp. 20TX0035]MDB6453219.1 NAD(P)H-hydrate dehydratase [Falsirhodobacter sp. 20TX0035]